jgi:hypothetical protein
VISSGSTTAPVRLRQAASADITTRAAGERTGTLIDFPPVVRSSEGPPASAPDIERDLSSDLCDRLILIRESPNERTDHNREVLFGVVPFHPNCFTNLLLMHPALRQIPRQVEPGRNRITTRPNDGPRGQHFDRGVIRIDLSSGPFEQVADHPSAQAVRAVYPRLVLAIKSRDEVRVDARHIEQSAGVSVATSGEPPEVIVEQMQRNVLYPPTDSLGSG